MAKSAIAILGDWFIDENRVVEPSYSAASSRTGPDHKRALGNPDEPMIGFCGAARVARWLVGSDDYAHVVGFGWWAEGDTDRLRRLLIPEGNMGRNRFALTRSPFGDRQPLAPWNPWLVNLAECLRPSGGTQHSRRFGTSLIERTYQARGDHDLEIIQRRDFEYRPGSGVEIDEDLLRESLEPAQVFQSRLKELESDLTRRLREIGVNKDVAFKFGKDLASLQSSAPDTWKFDAFVIVDYQHKGVDRDAVEKVYNFLESDSEVPRFVYLKEWPVEGEAPPWLPKQLHTIVLPSDAVRLWWQRGRLADSIAPSGYPETCLHPRAWFCLGMGSNAAYPAFDVVEWLLSIARRSHAEWVIATPPGGLLAIHHGESDDWVGYYHAPTAGDHEYEPYGGRASAFLASWVKAWTQTAPPSNVDLQLEESLKDGVAFARADALALRDVLKGEKSPESSAPERGRFPITRISRDKHTDRLNWDHHKAKSLPVWRACPDIPGYAEIVPARRRELTILLRLLDGYSQRPTSPVSALIVAPPGSGKSFLIERIAKFLNLEVFTMNLSQIVSFAELREEFARLEAVVTESPEQPQRIVFVDEVNAKIEGQYSYGAFLTILGEGQLQKRGYTSRLGPLAWVFAGTDYLVDEPGFNQLNKWLESKTPERDDPEAAELRWRTRDKRGLPPTMRPGGGNFWSDYAATKAPDFVSRLDLRRVTLNPTSNQLFEERNRCFVAASIVAACHKRVTQMDRGLIREIAGWQDATNRDIKQALTKATPLRERICLRDLPSWARKKMKGDGDDEYVNLERVPGAS